MSADIGVWEPKKVSNQKSLFAAPKKKKKSLVTPASPRMYCIQQSRAMSWLELKPVSFEPQTIKTVAAFFHISRNNHKKKGINHKNLIFKLQLTLNHGKTYLISSF